MPVSNLVASPNDLTIDNPEGSPNLGNASNWKDYQSNYFFISFPSQVTCSKKKECIPEQNSPFIPALKPKHKLKTELKPKHKPKLKPKTKPKT
jgi:hypothetical protein